MQTPESTATVRAAADAPALATEWWGDAGRGLVLAHGGGQTRHAWDRTAPELAAHGWRVAAYDLRGHGESEWAADGDYDIERLADDLLAVAATLPQKPVVVGASVSGITGLLAATRREPSAFAALVLVDVAPTLRPSGVDAILGFMKAHLDTGFESVAHAAHVIAQYLPHRPRPADHSGLAKNLRLGADGRYRWHWDPAFIRGERWASTEPHRERLLDATRSLTIPTLLIRGRLSQLVSDEAVAEFRAAAPHAVYRDLAGADHMIAGDRNDRFNACILEFAATL